MTTMTPEQLTARLGEAIPEQLKCVVLYGSAAAGDFVPVPPTTICSILSNR